MSDEGSAQSPLDSRRMRFFLFYRMSIMCHLPSQFICDALLESINACFMEGFHAPFCIFITEFLSTSLRWTDSLNLCILKRNQSGRVDCLQTTTCVCIVCVTALTHLTHSLSVSQSVSQSLTSTHARTCVRQVTQAACGTRQMKFILFFDDIHFDNGVRVHNTSDGNVVSVWCRKTARRHTHTRPCDTPL